MTKPLFLLALLLGASTPHPRNWTYERGFVRNRRAGCAASTDKAVWDDSRKPLTALGDASWSNKFLNLAIGGNNGGDPSATKFPARFEVDYVRVYQRIAR